MKTALGHLACVVALALGCGEGGDDAGGHAGQGGHAPTPDACHRQCEAQDALAGCRPLVDLATCKTACNQLIAKFGATCAAEFDAYYGCSADAAFMCVVGRPSQPERTCEDERSEFQICTGESPSTSSK